MRPRKYWKVRKSERFSLCSEAGWILPSWVYVEVGKTFFFPWSLLRKYCWFHSEPFILLFIYLFFLEASESAIIQHWIYPGGSVSQNLFLGTNQNLFPGTNFYLDHKLKALLWGQHATEGLKSITLGSISVLPSVSHLPFLLLSFSYRIDL